MAATYAALWCPSWSEHGSQMPTASRLLVGLVVVSGQMQSRLPVSATCDCTYLTIMDMVIVQCTVIRKLELGSSATKLETNLFVHIRVSTLNPVCEPRSERTTTVVNHHDLDIERCWRAPSVPFLYFVTCFVTN